MWIAWGVKFGSRQMIVLSFFYTDVKEWKSQSGFAWYIQALHDGVKSSLISMPILISIVFTWRRSPIHCFSFVGVKHLGFQLTLLKEGLFWVISDWSKVLCSIWCQFKLAPLTKRWKAWPLGQFWVISGAERFPDSCRRSVDEGTCSDTHQQSASKWRKFLACFF